ncbi:MAG: GGDEF domain-containing protein [Erysipelotrichaceae bacterium]|nr:GGDEF domain-containing protein [Erysipelotrichaceae bacterium]
MSKKYSFFKNILVTLAILITAGVLIFTFINKDNFSLKYENVLSCEDIFESHKSNGEEILSTTLPAIRDNEYITLWRQQNFTYADIDGIEIYRTEDTHFFSQNSSLGEAVMFIPLAESYSGMRLNLHFEGEAEFNSIYLSSFAEFVNMLFFTDKLRLLLCAIIVIVAFVVIGFYIVMKRSVERNISFSADALLCLGVFFFNLALWVLTDAGLTFFLAPFDTGMLSYYSFMLLPLTFMALVNHVLSEKSKRVSGTIMLAALNIIVQTVLFVSGIMDLPDMLVATHVVYIVTIIIVFNDIFADYRDSKDRTATFLVMGLMFCALMGVTAVLSYWILPDFDYIFFVNLAVIVMVIFIIMAVVEYIKKLTIEEVRNEEIQYFAYTDLLTGLKNRNSYERRMEEIENKGYDPDLYVMQMDVNFLKQTNDAMGHKAGDELLIGAAECMMKAFDNTEDIYRIGGDEYVIIDYGKREDMESRLNNLKKIIDEWVGENGNKLYVAAGYSRWDRHSDLSFGELLELADKAMYEDKSEFYRNSGIDRRRR